MSESMKWTVIHYCENKYQKRYRLKSSGDFGDGALCGNGNAHAKTTRSLQRVSCLLCVERLKVNGNLTHPVGA